MREFHIRPQSAINPMADAYGEACLKRSAQVAREARCVLDIPYGRDPDQNLDIYMPGSEACTGMPVMVFFHGGGFTHGYKEWCGFMAPPIVAHPAVFVSAAYRLMPSVDYPASIQDAAHALRWVHDHIEDYGGSPDCIFVAGHSAGALFAALLALDADLLGEVGLEPSVIKGALPISGTMIGEGKGGSIGYDVPPGPLQAGERSPIALARKAPANTAPFLLMWGGGERQRERVERSNMMLIAALRDSGVPVEWIMEPDADHFTIHLNCTQPASPWLRSVRRWFEGPPINLMGQSRIGPPGG